MQLVDEATLSQLKRKQQSIVRLFPDFFSNPIKVRGVIDKGGVRMESMENDTWTFRIHSGSEDGKWYEAKVRWKNIVPTIQNLVADRRNWNRAKTKIDLRKLSAKMFDKADVELSCECPADLYWGKKFIRSQDRYRANYGDPENRSPDIRNPKKYGAFCKHIQVLMRVLPFYKSTMSNWIKREHGDVISEAEERARREAERFRAVGRELGRRRRGPRESINEANLGPLSIQMKKRWGAASESEMMQTSTYRNEEQYVKLWLLADGTFIHVPRAHITQLPGDEYRLERMYDEGAVRIASELEGEMDLEYDMDMISDLQIRRIRELARLHGTKSLVFLDEEPVAVRSSSDISRALRGEEIQEPSLVAQFHESRKSICESVLPNLQKKLLDYWQGKAELDFIEAHTIILNDGTLIGGTAKYHAELLSPLERFVEGDPEAVLVDSGAVFTSDDTGYSRAISIHAPVSGISEEQWIPIRQELHDGGYPKAEIQLGEDPNFYEIYASDVGERQFIALIRRLLQGQSIPARFHQSIEEATKSPSQLLQTYAKKNNLLYNEMPQAFFLLSNGEFVYISGTGEKGRPTHEGVAQRAGTDLEELLVDGVIRGFHIPAAYPELFLELSDDAQLTTSQFAVLRRSMQQFGEFVIDRYDPETGSIGDALRTRSRGEAFQFVKYGRQE